MRTLIATFHSREQGEEVVQLLGEMGYDAGRLGYATRSVDEEKVHEIRTEPAKHGDAGDEATKGVAGGAVGGGAAGAGAALLASAGMLAIPGVGPFLAAGTLVGTLGAAGAGAAGGAALGGLAGAIFGASTKDEETDERRYTRALDEGGAVVTVDAENEEATDLIAWLEENGADQVETYDEGIHSPTPTDDTYQDSYQPATDVEDPLEDPRDQGLR